MNHRRINLAFTLLLIAALGCNMPSFKAAEPISTSAVSGVQVTATFTETLAPGVPSLTPTLTPTPCSPTVTASLPVNIRTGPGTVYPSVDVLSTGQTVTATGKNAESTWFVINRPSGGGTGWVAASVVTANCIPSSLAVVAAPPTPLPASGTCKDNYVWRLIRPSDKVCVTPAAKAQADADNAAHASRLATATYGPATCASGYVWREAYTGDVVCVDPAVRTQAANDNAAAPGRIDPLGLFGPDTCISGYVWREANGSDHVCVDPAVRSQAASDNAAAASRLATAVYGPNTCASGFVWRDAFSGDQICVTPATRTQVAADNAAAPSHTWP